MSTAISTFVFIVRLCIVIFITSGTANMLYDWFSYTPNGFVNFFVILILSVAVWKVFED